MSSINTFSFIYTPGENSAKAAKSIFNDQRFDTDSDAEQHTQDQQQLVDSFEEMVTGNGVSAQPTDFADQRENPEPLNRATSPEPAYTFGEPSLFSTTSTLFTGLAPMNPLSGIASVTSIFSGIMGLTETLGMQVDPEGLIGPGIFGNLIGDDILEISTDGIEQNSYMGFLPSHALKMKFITQGV